MELYKDAPTLNYVDILRREFSLRTGKNPHYSLRAFAQYIGMSPASLSLILKKKQNLGSKRAEDVAKKLGLSSEETRHFIFSAGKSCLVHKNGKSVSALSELYELKNKEIDLLGQWYNLAILELTEVTGIRLTKEEGPDIIAKALGISGSAAQMALSNLEEANLLKFVDGQYRQTKKKAFAKSNSPSTSIRSFHEQILQKAQQAIYEQSIEERELGALIVPLSPQDLEWAKVEMRKLRRRLMLRAERSNDNNKSHLYCLATQLFSLLKTKS